MFAPAQVEEPPEEELAAGMLRLRGSIAVPAKSSLSMCGHGRLEGGARAGAPKGRVVAETITMTLRRCVAASPSPMLTVSSFARILRNQ